MLSERGPVRASSGGRSRQPRGTNWEFGSRGGTALCELIIIKGHDQRLAYRRDCSIVRRRIDCLSSRSLLRFGGTLARLPTLLEFTVHVFITGRRQAELGFALKRSAATSLAFKAT